MRASMRGLMKAKAKKHPCCVQGGARAVLCTLGPARGARLLFGGVSTGPALPVALASTWHLFLALKIHPERTFFFSLRDKSI